MQNIITTGSYSCSYSAQIKAYSVWNDGKFSPYPIVCSLSVPTSHRTHTVYKHQLVRAI